MKRIHLAMLCGCLLFCLQANGQESPLKPQTQNGIDFVSGGIGDEEIKAMRAIKGEYNLHLSFAVRGTGEYASDVKVRIADTHGKTLLEAVSDGPNFFAKLKPGRYEVTADLDGKAQRKELTVGPKHGAAVSLYWSKEKGD